MTIIEIIGVGKTITHDWHIKEDEVLVLRNAKLRFTPQAGIFSLGKIEAENCTFIAVDVKAGWKGIADIGKGHSSFVGCKFIGGRGRPLSELKNHFISRYFEELDDLEVIEDWTDDLSQEERDEAYAMTIGGALITLNSSVHSSTFENCSVYGDGGGMVATFNVKIDECIFRKCFAGGDGGAVHILEYTTIKRCRFEDCRARGEGGAIKTNTSTRIEESLFIGCRARNGGGVLMENQLSRMNNCHFIKCVSSRNGGGISGYVHAERLAFIRCRSGHDGGGAELEDGSTLSDSLFYLCRAKDEAGGLCSFANQRVEIEWCKFIQCIAGDTGGAARIRHTTMSKCLFKNNTIKAEKLDGVGADHIYTSRDSMIDQCTFEGCRFEMKNIPQIVLFESMIIDSKYSLKHQHMKIPALRNRIFDSDNHLKA